MTQSHLQYIHWTCSTAVLLNEPALHHESHTCLVCYERCQSFQRSVCLVKPGHRFGSLKQEYIGDGHRSKPRRETVKSARETQLMNTEAPSTGYTAMKNISDSPAVLGGVKREEVHAGKDSRQGVEVRGEVCRKLTPCGIKENQGTFGAVGIQELHQILWRNSTVSVKPIFLCGCVSCLKNVLILQHLIKIS